MELTLSEALEKGVKAHESGKLQDADKYYTSILRVQPRHPDANHNMGILAVGIGKPDQALQYLKTAVDVNPDVEQYWVSYTKILIDMGHKQIARDTLALAGQGRMSPLIHDQLSQALEELCRHPTSKNPSARALDSLTSLYAEGRLAHALKVAENLLHSFPESPVLYNIQAASFVGLRQFDKAIEVFHTSIKLSPRYYETYNNLGLVHKLQGQLEPAIKNYEIAIRLNPNYADAYYNLGDALKDKGKLDQAIEAYNKAIYYKPQFEEAHNNLGIAHHANGRLGPAIKNFHDVIKLNPNKFDAYFNLGNAQMDMNQLDASVESFERAINIKPDYFDAYNHKALVLLKNGDVDAALASFMQAIAINPEYAEAHNNIGLLQLQQGNLDLALASFKSAINLNPNLFEAHNNLGNAFKEEGNAKAAIQSYRNAIRVKPNFADAVYNLALVLQGVRQYADSVTFFEQAADLSLDDADKLEKIHSFLLKSLFELDDKGRFYERLTDMINKGHSNAVIGSFCSRATLQHPTGIKNPFCNEPLRFVSESYLPHNYDFKSIFVGPAFDILGMTNTAFRHQTLVVNGHQTSGNLFDNTDFNVNKIREVIVLEIEKYRQFFKNSDEGMITQWPKDYSLRGWLVSYKNGGNILPHIHEEGWLSGSVYINVPKALDGNCGNLVVSLDDSQSEEPGFSNSRKIVDVRTGSLCIFPASLHHHTIPFESSEDRIVLAFDMVPKKSYE